MSGPRAPLAVACAALLGSGALAADGGAWQVGKGDVRVVCPLTVGGSFEAKTTALTGSLTLANARPATFGGALEVDLKTLDTGISLRNEHLRTNYLEVGKGEGFEKAVLSEIRLGDVDAGSFQGRTTFSGTLALHGTKKAVSGPAEVRRNGGSVRVDATFPLLLADFGIAKPQYLGVGVREQVEVKVSLTAAAQ